MRFQTLDLSFQIAIRSADFPQQEGALRLLGSVRPTYSQEVSDLRYLVSTMLLVVGLIHLLPLSGVLGNERLLALYGLSFGEPNLEILMRHRSVLFGLFGAFFVCAAFRRGFQTPAIIMGFVSVIAFLALAWSVGSYNAQVGRVVTADIVALVCLLIGGAAQVSIRRAG